MAGACANSISIEIQTRLGHQRGAYTAVDRAEFIPDLAWQVECQCRGPCRSLALRNGGKLAPRSTDFVSTERPASLVETSPSHATLGVYRQTKAARLNRRTALFTPEQLTILRTAGDLWPGGKNFCLTMLGLHRRNAETENPRSGGRFQVGWAPTAPLTPGQALLGCAPQSKGGGVLLVARCGVQAAGTTSPSPRTKIGVSAGIACTKPPRSSAHTRADYDTSRARPAIPARIAPVAAGTSNCRPPLGRSSGRLCSERLSTQKAKPILQEITQTHQPTRAMDHTDDNPENR